jgi:hypothetical protein
MGNSSTRFVWPAATASVRPLSMNVTPSHVSWSFTFWTCAPRSRSMRSSPFACQPLCVTAAVRPSGLIASPSGKSPTFTCLPAGERNQPFGRRTRPSDVWPGTSRGAGFVAEKALPTIVAASVAVSSENASARVVQ